MLYYTFIAFSFFSLSLVSSVCVCVCARSRMIDLSRQLHSCEAVSQFGLTCISATRSIFVQLLQQTKGREREPETGFLLELWPGIM